MKNRIYYQEVQVCPCGNLTHLDLAYPNKGYTKYCSSTCSRKYQSSLKEYNTILENKDWLYDQLINLKIPKEKLAKELNCSVTVINKWIKYHNILLNNTRIFTNKKIPVPPKEILENLYFNENMTLLDIAKYFNTSNVTVKKWFVVNDIPLLSHSQTIIQKVVPKIIDYNRQHYDADHFFSTDIGREKVKNTFMEKYGVPYHPIESESKGELEVLDYVNSISPGFKKTLIHGIELDGFNRDSNVAFEYHGIYFHSEKSKGKNLQEKKYKICSDNNIRLFSIFEDEWLTRQKQVKSFIKSALGKNECKIFARNLICKEFHSRNPDILSFIENTHIQGKPNERDCLKHFALVDNDNNIYSVMSFSRHHRTKNEVVLSRYCVKDNYNIPGGASKIFSCAIKYFNCNIKTWSDNRWTEGNIYSILGFEHVQNIKKDYFYVKNGKRIHKQSMTRKRLNAHDNQTEYEKAQELGYDRIWDCGKKTWIYKI